ncbi:TetR/AcrR family transcriptional regulator [Pseudomonas sp. GD03858]|uniref:TetR/AcrR family transcriptional regulator n=1 Tax=unclassified Pseudomonas TaxID=196821 RepID=UPI002447F11C|nr:MULTISPECIES: TetR/AcrR family transcriptional regulator [unclassified Pseudomonas]MDH0645382.1 TetR/AcrR family transcriptional regulator [Pseudomonas sp. GD03867]MDH0663950.1 TetR/AcrR family transcriptional regulator [Pseudomonas sp. GD03858]
MQAPPRSPGRGRPRTITRERIADVSIAIGLPDLTFVGVAAALGVSHMALYKHVPNIEALKCLVAEEVFQRWQIPQACADSAQDLQAYLMGFAASVQAFVKAHPGLTPYVIRRLAATQAMIDKINDHQAHIAQAYGLSLEQSRWLLSTVAFHGFAVADSVYSVSAREPLLDVDRAGEESEMEQELSEGMRALIVGALVLLAQR